MAKTVAVAEQSGAGAGLQQLKGAPARLGEFLKSVRAEMKKVVTPSRDEVQTTTIIVIITVFLFAAYFAVVDSIVGRLIDILFRHLTKQ